MTANHWVFIERVLFVIILVGGLSLIYNKIEVQGQRSDRLYEMFIDLLKEQRR